MIIQTGQRTDIPAFYSQWFLNRLKAGFVMVRNPYNPQAVTRYRLTPDVVDLIGFCTKNPGPMLPHMAALEPYGQYWFVTITPYGRNIEPHVPPWKAVLEDFRTLSRIVGLNRIGWRYDPILVNEEWPAERHVKAFEYMAGELEGYTETAVISFIDLYPKVQRNYPEVRTVSREDRLTIGKAFIEVGKQHGMTIRPCAEGNELAPFGADCSGCMTISTYEKALGQRLSVPKSAKSARNECACYLSGDIGAYNSCGHLCRYCYANADADLVRRNMGRHDPESSFLIGHSEPDDMVHEAVQESWIDRQIRMEL